MDVLADTFSFRNMDEPTLMYLLNRDDLKLKELDIFNIAVKLVLLLKKFGESKIHYTCILVKFTFSVIVIDGE